MKKTSPTNGQIITSDTTILSWAVSTGATSYKYCYAITTQGCNPTDPFTWRGTSLRTADIIGLSDGATYYWQVRATNPTGTTYADNSTYGSFTVDLKPAAFTKTSPENAGLIRSPTTTLSWAASTGATSYKYCYAITTQYCNSNVSTWTSTGSLRTADIIGLSHGTNYYWQVRAINTSGTTTADMQGGDWTFTVSLPPAAFTKTSPENRGTTITSPTTTLSWAASARATSYEYRFCPSWWTCASVNWISTTDTTADITGMTNGWKSWDVRAINAAGTTLSDEGDYAFFVNLP